MLLLALLAATQISYQTAHEHHPEVLALSPTAPLLAAASSAEYAVRIWDLNTQQLVRLIPSGQQACVAFSPDGKQLAIVDHASNVRINDVLTGQKLEPGPDSLGNGLVVKVTSLAMGDGNRLFATAAPGALHYTAGKQWKKLELKNAERLVTDPRVTRGLLWSPSGLTLVDLTQPAPALLKELPSPLQGRQDWDFTGAGKYLVGVSESSIALLDAASLETLKTFPVPARRVPYEKEVNDYEGAALTVAHMQLGPSATVDVNGLFVRIDLAKREIVSIGAGWENQGKTVFRQDGNLAIGIHGNTYANDDEMFTLLDPVSGARLGTYGGVSGVAPDIRFDGQDRLVWIMAASQHTSNVETPVRVLDIGGARELFTSDQHLGSFSPDGKTLVITSKEDGKLTLVTLTTSERRIIDYGKLNKDKFSQPGVWSQSGRYFAFRSHSESYVSKAETLWIWDTIKNAPAASVVSPTGIGADSIAFGPGDELAAVSIRPGGQYGDDGWSFRVLELASGKELQTHKGVAYLFSRDGKAIAVSRNDLRNLEASLIDARTGQALPELTYKDREASAAVARFYVEPLSQQLEFLAGRTVSNLSPDGKTVVIGSPDGTLRILDAATGTERKKQVQAHDGQIEAIRFSSDSKRMLTYSLDRLTSLWDVMSGEKIATFAVTGFSTRATPELAIFTPDGYYYGQRSAVREIALRDGMRAWPLAQFDAWLNRPDLVLERLGGAPKATVDYYRLARERRMAKLGLPDQTPELRLPEVTLKRDGLAASTTERMMPLSLELRSATSVQVYDNGVPLFGTKGTKPPVKVELSAGPNKLEITAIDSVGRESVAEIAQIELRDVARKPDLYALAVGVSSYLQKEYALQYAAKDAQDLLAAFSAPDGKRVYGEVHTKAIVDGEATREGIVSAARQFLEQAQTDDRVVIFFAGHGLLDARAGYFFATTDLDFEHPEARGLSFEQMESLLAGLKARHRLMLVDTCAAGETDEDEVARKSGALPSGTRVASRGFKSKSAKVSAASELLMTRELFGSLRRGSGASVIGSSSGVEYAFESAELKNGVFTAALLETLRGKDVNGKLNWDPTMGIGDLSEQVRSKVLARSGGQQHPVARETNPDDQFTIWRSGWYAEQRKPTKKKARK